MQMHITWESWNGRVWVALKFVGSQIWITVALLCLFAGPCDSYCKSFKAHYYLWTGNLEIPGGTIKQSNVSQVPNDYNNIAFIVYVGYPANGLSMTFQEKGGHWREVLNKKACKGLICIESNNLCAVAHSKFLLSLMQV